MKSVAQELPLKGETRPLAEQLRPAAWEQFAGLDTLDKRLIKQLREGAGRAPSLILWGPPGCGKTTLAKLIGNSYKARFIQFSAVLGGVKEVREIVDEAKAATEPTILFVDEIHRFNKGQQDAFLPHVEQGTISLIGATTENPSFSLTQALLSRCKVVVLPSINAKAMETIVEEGLKSTGVTLSEKSKRILVEVAAGDGRRALNIVEQMVAAGLTGAVSEETLLAYLNDAKVPYYDRSGEEHYNVVSAFIKSMRGSDADAALFWGFKMLEGGEDPRFLIRRMMIFASEDVGNADPRGLQIAVATSEAYERLGLPEGRIPIAHCITYLATAPKSNRSYSAMHKAVKAVKDNPKAAVPLHLRNAPTKLMKGLGYGAEYEYPHDTEHGYSSEVTYLPQELEGEVFYQPTERGYEKTIKERLDWLKSNKK